MIVQEKYSVLKKEHYSYFVYLEIGFVSLSVFLSYTKNVSMPVYFTSKFWRQLGIEFCTKSKIFHIRLNQKLFSLSLTNENDQSSLWNQNNANCKYQAAADYQIKL